uniref:Uncharacterized protein n=1 Tax=Streptomyces kanamyceticus TaxID=1967 RepID=E9KTC7_STRKN|nr:hypothetical protein Tcs_SK_043 [Streptomyces kanamyceticus]
MGHHVQPLAAQPDGDPDADAAVFHLAAQIVPDLGQLHAGAAARLGLDDADLRQPVGSQEQRGALVIGDQLPGTGLGHEAVRVDGVGARRGMPAVGFDEDAAAGQLVRRSHQFGSWP